MSRSSGHSKKKLSASLAKTGLLPVNSTAARVQASERLQITIVYEY
jgi:hypothetical protein